ncbi:unnamed protein product [Ostreobium quekettii]|uniref:Phosphatidic acid phosphatase type 2/haloperoxidase domain-containing protein n=1 Tax=Ostreobium quekettii TaxID=121088 RepID=A0A8S1IM56_9CHLO|nr:unnamed protein product [Ostreobium quekettii]|eukprot:evm.model.scf_116.10 EVM.evm.TU.scf_116.10   scf_116:94556-95245(-)
MPPEDADESDAADDKRRGWAAGLCAGCAEADRRASRALHARLGRRVPRRGYLALEHAGSALLIPLVLLLALVSRLSGPFQALFVNMSIGFITDLALVGCLKAAVRRPRPAYNDAEDYALVVSVDRHSFPSGHASRALFIAALTTAWGVPALWLALAWAWGGLVGLSRVMMGRHYLTDVVGGWVVGLLNAVIVTGGTLGRGGCLVREGELHWGNASSHLREARVGGHGLG